MLCRDALGVPRMAEIIERRVLGKTAQLSRSSSLRAAFADSVTAASGAADADANADDCDGADAVGEGVTELAGGVDSGVNGARVGAGENGHLSVDDSVRYRTTSTVSCMSEGADVGGGELERSSSIAGQARPGDIQYYVHYVSFNRRLDEWVTEDRFDTDSIAVSV